MGLLTVDVNPLGIVMASDSQPVDMLATQVKVHVGSAKEGTHVVRAQIAEFSGFAGYVGMEAIGGRPAKQWLRDALAAGFRVNAGQPVRERRRGANRHLDS